MKKSILIITVLLSVLLLFAACTSDAEETSGDNGDVKKVLTIGVDDTYPPMEYRDENNELVGFDVALAKAIGEKLDMEVKFISTGWDGIFSGLKTENYDAIISSVSITPLRLKEFDFSDAYLSNGQVIVVKPGDTSVTKPEDLAGKNVGVQIETTADVAAQKYKEENDFEIIRYDEIIQTFNAMKAGHVDYIVVDYPVAIEYVKNDVSSFEISTAQLTNEPIGVCLRKGDKELQEKINGALEELRADGTLKAISEEWLGSDYTTDIDLELNVIE
ncbi:transporter substrate-binding domain-containing protein [Alkalibaculum sp. M08DMB]|uniref:Transporter substrate-binding domain-containing protein n=1 Tax=Alkalibaculum sporogenes TaxID=2655001 RepID=A0A6A7K992_9FIRM|nr:ABC transporter substrate-binding protein [Alkalibaculum sporogenes]MPW25994.1 transporter substrate-binding domain-containing protein [Alkalibaculum sporogenes]